MTTQRSTWLWGGACAGLPGRLVTCLWRDDTGSGQEQQVLPDGCIDRIWMDGAVHVAGPYTAVFLTPLVPGR